MALFWKKSSLRPKALLPKFKAILRAIKYQLKKDGLLIEG
jgi:hypothetical protein